MVALVLAVYTEQRPGARVILATVILGVIGLVGEIMSAGYSGGSPLKAMVDNPNIASIVFDRLVTGTKIITAANALREKVWVYSGPGFTAKLKGLGAIVYGVDDPFGWLPDQEKAWAALKLSELMCQVPNGSPGTPDDDPPDDHPDNGAGDAGQNAEVPGAEANTPKGTTDDAENADNDITNKQYQREYIPPWEWRGLWWW